MCSCVDSSSRVTTPQRKLETQKSALRFFELKLEKKNKRSKMDLLNRALEQVIDQLVTQKVSLLKLEIESQKKTIFGEFLSLIVVNEN